MRRVVYRRDASFKGAVAVCRHGTLRDLGSLSTAGELLRLTLKSHETRSCTRVQTRRKDGTTKEICESQAGINKVSSRCSKGWRSNDSINTWSADAMSWKKPQSEWSSRDEITEETKEIGNFQKLENWKQNFQGEKKENNNFPGST